MKLQTYDCRLPLAKNAPCRREETRGAKCQTIHGETTSNRNRNSSRGFSLLELLVVMAIMSIMMGVMVNSGMGGRPAGSRQGAITQLMGALEEARMSAIEKRVKVYFGIADTTHPDSEKQLCAYIFFRDQTADEKAVSKTEDVVPITRWTSLPRGFYFDLEKISNMLIPVPGKGLAGNPPTVQVLEFGTLGQVTGQPVGGTPQIAVADAVFDPASQNLQRRNNGAGDFAVNIYRLTGRLQLAQTQIP